MKILGIGNAIVDVICKVDDSFISKNNLTKSTMKLFFDENEFKNLLTNLKIEKTVSGGSVANSIVGLAQLGDEVGFIGKVSDDDFGEKYEEGLKKENVEYFYSKKKEKLPTGTCLILVTPDSERTMCTFLGTAGKINENDINTNAVKNSEILFLEGYLWDEGEPKKAFEKAINNSNKTAMSLSDLFCVERHKSKMRAFVQNNVDILFCNEGEVKALYETNSLDDAINMLKSEVGIGIVTKGEHGAIIVEKSIAHEIEAFPTNVVDTTGAGDFFAAGFLAGVSKNYDLVKAGMLGAACSSEIISHYGGRPENELKAFVKNKAGLEV